MDLLILRLSGWLVGNLIFAPLRGRTQKKKGKLMDICGLVVFLYSCSGWGQPHGADKLMWLKGRCCPGSVTDLCPSISSSCVTAAPLVPSWFFEPPCWRCSERQLGAEWENGRVGRLVNATLFSDRAGLCSYWQLMTAALTYTVHHIASLGESYAWIQLLCCEGTIFYQNTQLLFIPRPYNSMLRSLLPPPFGTFWPQSPMSLLSDRRLL